VVIFRLFGPLKALLIFLPNKYFILQINFLNIKSTFKPIKCNLKQTLNDVTYGMCVLFRGFKGCFYSGIKRFTFIEGLKKKKEKHSILLFKYLGLLLIFEVACQLLSFNDYKEIKETEREKMFLAYLAITASYGVSIRTFFL
jgi:hypothetical protein